jgi:hypothetical protein
MIITGASVTDGTAQPCVGAAEGFAFNMRLCGSRYEPAASLPLLALTNGDSF